MPLRSFLVSLVLAATVAAPPALAQRVYDVRTFGAKGDSVTLDTDAINRAIDAAAAAVG